MLLSRFVGANIALFFEIKVRSMENFVEFFVFHPFRGDAASIVQAVAVQQELF